MIEENNKNDKVPEKSSGENEASETISEDTENNKDLTVEEIVSEEISESIGSTTNVERIENIEKVEISNSKLNAFMSYFPHLIVGLISLIALAGLIYIVWINTKSDVDSTEAARSLITYLVAVITIVIALILTLMAFFSTLPDFKERFVMGKEVLTILIGVLGTIVGFYFGSAKTLPPSPTPTPTPTATATPNPGTVPAAN